MDHRRIWTGSWTDQIVDVKLVSHRKSIGVIPCTSPLTIVVIPHDQRVSTLVNNSGLPEPVAKVLDQIRQQL